MDPEVMRLEKERDALLSDLGRLYARSIYAAKTGTPIVIALAVNADEITRLIAAIEGKEIAIQRARLDAQTRDAMSAFKMVD